MFARCVSLFILSLITALGQIPTDAEIHQILVDRVGAENAGIGIVVGVIDANGRRVIAYGSLARDDKRRLGGDTVFEIGSMTKVFTSLLLMDMARRHEVALTDPVAKYLPANVKVPERKNRKITLADLSTQSSGLPRMPSNFAPKDELNPYADYTVQQLYEFLSEYELKRDIGSQYEYSNVGVGLLGHALSLRAGMSYEALVRARICDPLGMKDTRVTLTPGMKARLATGHSATLTPVPNWDLPALAGAGALRSTANDMLTFVAANLGYLKTPLAPAMADEISVRHPAGAPDLQIAYAWHIQSKEGSSIIWHNGGTGGYRSYMGFDPKTRIGVVVLTNVSTETGADDIGRHLLNASYPLMKVKPPTERKEITLDPKSFDKYAGVYRLGPYALLVISREEARFYAQLTGQQKVEIFAQGENTFFYKVVDAQLTFGASSVTLHQNGADTVAKRLSEGEVKKALEEVSARTAEIAKHFREQSQSPGTEAALRRHIQELEQGAPDFDKMSPQLAALARTQAPQFKTLLSQLGAVESTAFKGVAPNGADIFEVKFEHGTTEWRILLSPDGKTQVLGIRPL